MKHPQIALTSEDGSTKLMVNADDLIFETNGIPNYLREEEAVLIAIYVAHMINEEDSRLWVKNLKMVNSIIMESSSIVAHQHVVACLLLAL